MAACAAAGLLTRCVPTIAGQDQMRIVKQRLLEMIPDLRIFLDVDGAHV